MTQREGWIGNEQYHELMAENPIFDPMTRAWHKKQAQNYREMAAEKE